MQHSLIPLLLYLPFFQCGNEFKLFCSIYLPNASLSSQVGHISQNFTLLWINLWSHKFGQILIINVCIIFCILRPNRCKNQWKNCETYSWCHYYNYFFKMGQPGNFLFILVLSKSYLQNNCSLELDLNSNRRNRRGLRWLLDSYNHGSLVFCFLLWFSCKPFA